MCRSELDAFWEGAAPSSRERFTSTRFIGSGAYTVVAKATDTKTGDTAAIKRIAEVFYDAQEAGLPAMPPRTRRAARETGCGA